MESRFWEGTYFFWDCSVTGAIHMNNHIQKSLSFYKLEIWAIRWKEIFTVIFLRSWSHGEWHILVFLKKYLETHETTLKKMKIPWKPWMKLPRKPWKYFEKSWKPTKNHVTTLKNQHTGMFWQTNRKTQSVLLFYKDHVSFPIISIYTVALLPVLLIRLPFWSNDYQRSFTKLALKIQIENLRQISIMSFFRAFKCFTWGQSTNGVTLEYNCKPDKPRRTTQYRLPTEKNRVF